MATTTLRAVTHRLTTTPVEQLPPIASFLATSLSDCAELLSAPQTQKPGKSDSDHAVQVHKLKTRLASLLQDRSVEGRWTAVVLVKAAVEAGQWEILRGYEPIVRNLVGILAKPDPISTRKMCIITLTRIFHLTYQYPTLVREITTPHLPGFITATLNLVSVLVKGPSGSSRKSKPNSPFMETVLHALLELISRHPTIFRPFIPQLRSLLVEIIGSSPPAYFPENVVDAAEHLFTSLHKCAPKDKSDAGWNEDCKSTIRSIHRTADYLFRAVVEQWESVDMTLIATRLNYSQDIGDQEPDLLGLPGWTGVHAGADRLIMLLELLSDFISMPSTSAIPIPLGSILDLTSRLTSVTVPPESADPSQSSVQINSQIGRDERQMLWAELPRIHTTCMDLVCNVINLLESSTTPVMQAILDQITWVFRNEKFSRDIRSAVYDILYSLVSVNGPAMTKQNVNSLTNVLRACCLDVSCSTEESTPPQNAQSDSKSKSKTGQATANADSFLNPELQKARSAQLSSRFPELRQAASRLLQTVLVSVPAELLTPSLRAEIDRTIILTADKNAMLASVLNPVPAIKGRGAGSSIMPFLVRGYADQMEVEALVRPRMPVLMTAPELDAQADAEDEDEDENMPEEMYDAAPKTADFLRQPAPVVTPVSPLGSPAVADTSKPLHKRAYAEEATIQTATSSKPSEKTDVQPKKARFGESLPKGTDTPVTEVPATSVSQAVSAPTPVSTSTRPDMPSAQPQPPSTLPTPTSASAASLPVDDSDDELPTLNIEPDTDSEDEDDDVPMSG
ncbi:hypothetical protein N7474_002036 [Penicillium riverlandense]|uniref:uncharacterized protein n=1 Tax=Penicillium riverlandense TaxID=1903569 RepID=UPI0025499880|nr:uncharacterized protein N7474_002036 [Penicillium riverlandense]KAJ5833725.1 hypothetical protein N7474_002036 [Penicillium riverlandense]